MMDWTAFDCVIAGEADDGLRGLQVIEEIQPDIVISDIRMPNKDGLAMLRESIETYGYDAIILSGYQDFEYAKEAIHLGVTEYLVKPIDFDLLKESLQKIIAKRTSIDNQKHFEEGGILPLPDLKNIKSKYANLMLDYIKQHYSERISLTDLSQELEVSCTHLNAKFKLATGYTFHDFLNYYRIHQAILLQREGEYKMYEIAEKVGFSDYKYFTRVYKKYTGFAPKDIITQKF